MAPGSSISRLVVIVVGGVFLLGGRTAGRGEAEEEEEEPSAMVSSSEEAIMLFMLWTSLSRRVRIPCSRRTGSTVVRISVIMFRVAFAWSPRSKQSSSQRQRRRSRTEESCSSNSSSDALAMRPCMPDFLPVEMAWLTLPRATSMEILLPHACRRAGRLRVLRYPVKKSLSKISSRFFMESGKALEDMLPMPRASPTSVFKTDCSAMRAPAFPAPPPLLFLEEVEEGSTKSGSEQAAR